MSKYLVSLVVCVCSVSVALAIDPLKRPSQNLGDTATHEVGHVRTQPSRTTNYSFGCSNPTCVGYKPFGAPTMSKTKNFSFGVDLTGSHKSSRQAGKLAIHGGR